MTDSIPSPPPAASLAMWKLASAAAMLAAIILSVLSFALERFGATSWGLLVAMGVLSMMALLHVRFLSIARHENRRMNELLFTRERELQSIFERAQDAILLVDDQGVCQDANHSSCRLLGGGPIIGQSLRLYYSDPEQFDAGWNQLLLEESDQGEVELVRADGGTVFAEFTAAAHVLPRRHLIIFHDITDRHRAQQALHRSLDVARSSFAEADALRRATLALTKDLRMDRVLETLLQTLARFVPFEQAQLFLFESDSRLFLAREEGGRAASTLGFSETLDLSEFPIFGGAIEREQGLLVPDTLEEKDWRSAHPQNRSQIRAWIGVPIRAANQTLGVLSLAHSQPAAFSSNHLRLAQALATPAAVAIQNARLLERAEIYGTELERTLAELRRVEQALKQLQHGRRTSA